MQKSLFLENDLLFEGSGGPRGVKWPTKILPKFAQRDVLGTCKVWGAQKSRFLAIKFPNQGRALPADRLMVDISIILRIQLHLRREFIFKVAKIVVSDIFFSSKLVRNLGPKLKKGQKPQLHACLICILANLEISKISYNLLSKSL